MSDETRANATVFDYLRWRGDLTLAQDGFNEVDSLILCIISYINLKKLRQLWSFDPKDAMPMGDVCRQLTEEDEQLGLSTLDYIPLMRAAAETARFRDVSLFAFESLHDETQQMQFAAVSFLLPDGSVYVAYRGTDMTIVGWQEDFNMSFLSAVPAQLKATEYAEAVARACPRRPLRIGGHSKGGNLAAWAAVHLDEKLQRKRLISAYNNDGPGFSRDLVNEPCYQAVADRLFTFIPASSIVGVLLEHAEDYEVVDSTARSIMQHEPLSWCVEGPHFVHLGQRSQLGQLSDGVLREWIHDPPGAGAVLPGVFRYSQPGRPDQDPGGAAQRRTGRRSGPAAGVCRGRRGEEKNHHRDLPPPGGGREGRAGKGCRSQRSPGGREHPGHRPGHRRPSKVKYCTIYQFYCRVLYDMAVKFYHFENFVTNL